MIFKDDLGMPLKRNQRGRFVSYVVFTPYGGEVSFSTKRKALADHLLNMRNKVPSQVCIYENWISTTGKMLEIVDTIATYRAGEL